MIPEAVCSACKLKCYSLSFKEAGDHYCPECGEPLKLTGKEVFIAPRYIRSDAKIRKALLEHEMVPNYLASHKPLLKHPQSKSKIA